MSREKFRQHCVERDDGQCVVPDCHEQVTPSPDGPGEVHHIIERKLWTNGGYIPRNGVSICNEHHRLAERNIIPPQAFWRQLVENADKGGMYVPLPRDVHRGVSHATESDTVGVWTDAENVPEFAVDKWGEPLDAPPWTEHRDYIKYPSTRHLPWSHERDDDDTAHEQVDNFVEVPLVATIKMDGGNAMLVKDTDNPIRARNGRQADKEHFDMAKQWYWENNLYSKIPEYLQIFGEWLYAKHSIHYGCDCNEPCEDVGPALRDYFQVFGIYDTRFGLWLGWHETMEIAGEIGLTMAPRADVSYEIGEFDNSQHFWDYAYQLSQSVVEDGHEGIVIRSAYPFHYGQIERRLGKYVRPGHVKDGEEHWSNRETVQNRLQ